MAIFPRLRTEIGGDGYPGGLAGFPSLPPRVSIFPYVKAANERMNERPNGRTDERINNSTATSTIRLTAPVGLPALPQITNPMQRND